MDSRPRPRQAILGRGKIVLLLGLFLQLALTACRSGNEGREAVEKRVIILGIDGMDPSLLIRLVEEGKMPNFAWLMEEGDFRPLKTSTPPQSPVAWSTFITGMNPGGHGIFDFIHRDPATLSPYLSTSRTEEGSYLSLGSWRVPFSGGQVKLLRRGRAFWEALTQNGIPSTIMRVPANFPPAGETAHQLSGMGTPDLQGTYGTFSFFTQELESQDSEVSGGKVFPLTVVDRRFEAQLAGPPNSFKTDRSQAAVPFEGTVDPDNQVVKIKIQDHQFLLQQGSWSDWITIEFELVPFFHTVQGICRFYLKEVGPDLKIYVTPINIHPASPALPISTPADYSHQLSEQIGLFSTLGIPEDTKALSSGVLEDDEFLQQAAWVFQEELRMLDYGLKNFRTGLFFFYLGRLDQLSHMFWRSMDPKHPAYREDSSHAEVIINGYGEMDEVLGTVLKKTDGQTMLLVMSDHGFAPFYRSFHLNSWLKEQGYITLLDFSEGGLLQNVDWSQSRAYGFGFNGLYLNLHGREPRGIVRAGADRDALLEEISAKLLNLRDPDSGTPVVTQVYRTDQVYSGPMVQDGPDLVIGYNRGYRASWETTLGKFPQRVLEDNRGKWSGDHLMNAAFVPGILIVNRKIKVDEPTLVDLAPTILAEFGISKDPAMIGRPLL